MVICKKSVFKEAFDGLTIIWAQDEMKWSNSSWIGTHFSGEHMSLEEIDEAEFWNYQFCFWSMLGSRLAVRIRELGTWEDGRRWPPLESGQHRGGMIKWYQRSHLLFHWTFTTSTLFLGQDGLWRARSWTPWSLWIPSNSKYSIILWFWCIRYAAFIALYCTQDVCFLRAQIYTFFYELYFVVLIYVRNFQY